MSLILCIKCGKVLCDIDSRIKGQAVLICDRCKTVNYYSNPNRSKGRKRKSITYERFQFIEEDEEYDDDEMPF